MGMSRLKAVPAPPSLSPARAKLSQAIQRRDEAKARLVGVKAASESAMLESMSLRRDLDAAQARISEATDLHAKNIIERFMQRPPIAGMSIAEAKMAVSSLEEQYESTRSAREQIQSQHREIEQQVERAESEVNSAVSAVLWNDAPEVRRLLEEIRACTRTRIELMACLNAVGACPNHLLGFISINPETSDELPSKWRAAVQSLKESANAELP
jgi:chromosome segregation ATPase